MVGKAVGSLVGATVGTLVGKPVGDMEAESGIIVTVVGAPVLLRRVVSAAWTWFGVTVPKLDVSMVA